MATLIDAFQSWRRDLEAVEREMDQLIAAGLPASVEERQVRQARFVTLVERREAAARKLLQFDWIGRRNKRASLPESHLASAAQGDAEALPKAEALPDGCNKSVLPTSALPTDLVPLAPDVVVLPSVSAALLSAGAPADTAACPNDVVALAGLPAVSASAADLGADVPAGAAELPTDVVESATPIRVATADIPPAPTDRTHVAEDVPTESVGSDTSATHTKTTSSDDLDPSLMALLRRLQRAGRVPLDE